MTVKNRYRIIPFFGTYIRLIEVILQLINTCFSFFLCFLSVSLQKLSIALASSLVIFSSEITDLLLIMFSTLSDLDIVVLYYIYIFKFKPLV